MLIRQGKTTTILSVLKQLPKDYKVVLLKNEYGDVEGELGGLGSASAALMEKNGYGRMPIGKVRTLLIAVDSLLAKQGNITGVSEILNGCL